MCNAFQNEKLLICISESQIQQQIIKDTCWENMSNVFCPLVNIAAAINMAFAILKGNNSIA